MESTRNPQLDVIETLDRPVIVQAGAGSGKTHTLTERIVSALTPDVNGNTVARSIENIVAITFTNKAAEELKSRLRAKLEKAGLHEQALLVDDAHISTIHGFASRILRENALSFGIDANFEVIDEAENERIFKEALDISMEKMFSGVDMLENFMEETSIEADEIYADGDSAETEQIEDSDEYQPLFPDIQAEEELFDIAKNIRDQVESLITDLFRHQSNIFFSTFIGTELWSDGAISSKVIYDSVRRLVDSFSKSPLLDEPKLFVGTYLEVKDIFDQLIYLLKNSFVKIDFNMNVEKEANYVSAFNESIDALESFEPESLQGLPLVILEHKILDILDKIPKLTPKFHAKQEDYPFVVEYRQQFSRLVLEFLVALNKDPVMVFYRLAILTFGEMNEIKNDSKFSNNDLLRVCFQRLSLLPDVAKVYKEKFDLIMVDEFQDTDKLQLELMRLIAKDDFKNVCTVGDVQQSIYRFRGADLNVFRDYKNKMLKSRSGVKVVELPNNYRSHSDILSLTDRVFGNDAMFGTDFLHLVPKGDVNKIEDPIFKSVPRVQIQVMNHQTTGKEKFLTNEACVREAKKAAEHLKSLKDAGAKVGSMAVLLAKLTSGATTQSPIEIAKIYQEALLDVGIESIISGGSTFARSDEAQIVLSLLALARNPLDSVSLAYLLRSSLFSLSDDCMLALASNFDSEGKFVNKQDISYGFLGLDKHSLSTVNELDAEALAFAHECIMSYIHSVGSEGVVFAIRELLGGCGVFDQLQKQGSEGLVRAGNFEKALAIIREIQCKTTDVPEVHSRFNEYLLNAKEAPGVLSTINSDFVEIMTVHASKGLQFDHVVIAELKNGLTKRKNTIVTNTPLDSVGEFTYVASIKNIDRPELKSFALDKDLLFNEIGTPSSSMTAGQLYAQLALREREEELAESKRLLYVAITRAVKSVLLQIRIGSKPKDDYANCGIWGDLYKVFKWDYECSSSVQFFDLDNGSKGKLEFEFLTQALEFDEEVVENKETCEKTNKTQKLVVRQKIPKLPTLYAPKDESDFLSYSNFEKVSTKRPLDFDGELYYDIKFDSDKATDFGSKFHGYLEKAIILQRFETDGLNDERLIKAISRVFSTKVFGDVASLKNVTPEMEFCVPIKINGESKFLRGEIDLVGIDEKCAVVIDYKTGTKPIDHILQAQVYAYAILKGGLDRVELNFLHAEIGDESNEGALIQKFEFCNSDEELLRVAIEKVASKLL